MLFRSGDDEHGWDDEGVFNYEGGCYAKVINLDKESEPDIYAAIRRDALLENVTVDAAGKIDFADKSVTENTRVSYPIYHIENIVKPLSKGPHAHQVIFSVIGLAQDITDSVVEMRKIEYERDYDITTGLLNRRAFYYKFGRLFSAKKKLKTAACFMFDLDNLKYVNDTYGHDFGDDYIRTAASVFRLFESERSIVARLSGDEFILFFYGYDNRKEIEKIKQRLQEKLRESYCVLPDGAHYKMRASGGVAWYPKDAVDSDLLIKYADFAMYTVKHSTKGNIGEFDKQAYKNDAVLVTGIEELNRIIDDGSIRYAFQSIVSAKTGEIDRKSVV